MDATGEQETERRTRGRSTGPRQGADQNSTRPDAPFGAWVKALLLIFKNLAAHVDGFCGSSTCQATSCRRSRLCGRGCGSRLFSPLTQGDGGRPAAGSLELGVYTGRDGATRRWRGFLHWRGITRRGQGRCRPESVDAVWSLGNGAEADQSWPRRRSRPTRQPRGKFGQKTLDAGDPGG
jgi:hypothetical protein